MFHHVSLCFTQYSPGFTWFSKRFCLDFQGELATSMSAFMATAMWNLGQVTLLDDGKGSTWPPSKKLPIYRSLVRREELHGEGGGRYGTNCA